jgi:hypothetical protein
VKLVEQWGRIESRLPVRWGDARLVLTVDEDGRCDRAAALLAPAAPGRSGKTIHFYTARHGAGPSPQSVRRMLGRLDAEQISGRLKLVSTAEARAELTVARRTLADEWDAALAVLPADWSDLYGQVELTSTDHLDRAALLLGPINPIRYGEAPGYRYRAARLAGYGASPGMVRRCFARLDENDIPCRVQILHVLSDTAHAQTQGPVWHVSGKTV